MKKTQRSEQGDGSDNDEMFRIVPPSPQNWDRLNEIYREMDEAPDFLQSFAQNVDEMTEEMDKNLARGQSWLDQLEAHLRETQQRNA